MFHALIIIFQGFVVNNNDSLSSQLANNLNYDYSDTINGAENLRFRISQSTASGANITAPQLTLSIWSGWSSSCTYT